MESDEDQRATSSCYSSDAESQDCNRYMVLLPSHERTHALVEVLPNRSIRLPMTPTTSAFHPRPDLEQIISATLAVKVRCVRMIWSTPYEGNCELWGEKLDVVAVVLVQSVEEDKNIVFKEGMKWMSRRELDSGNWVRTDKELGLDAREATLGAMRELNGEVQVWRPFWRCMGWYTKIMGFVKEVSKWEIIDDALYKELFNLVNLHHSAVWRCNVDLSKSKFRCTTAGELDSVYIKATIPLFEEARRTVTIAKVLNELKIVPEVLAVQERDGMLMMRDAGSVEHDEEVDIKLMVETIVRMHELCVDRLDELKAGGLKVRDSEWLLSNVHRIMYHGTLDKVVSDSEKHTKMLSDIRSREEEVRDACKEISKFGVPNTLVHGDLINANTGSLKETGGRYYQFYDWDRSHIGHPFFDCYTVTYSFFEDLEGENSKERWNREFWKHWKSVGNEKEFKKLRDMVSIVSNFFGLDMFLKEAEMSDDGLNGVKEDLLDSVGCIQCVLDRFSLMESSNESDDSE